MKLERKAKSLTH